MITLIAVTLTFVVAIVAGALGLVYIEWGNVILLGMGLGIVWWFVKEAVFNS